MSTACRPCVYSSVLLPLSTFPRQARAIRTCPPQSSSRIPKLVVRSTPESAAQIAALLAGEHDRHRRPQRNRGFGRAWKCGYPTLDPTVDVIGRVAAAGSGPGGLGRRGGNSDLLSLRAVGRSATPAFPKRMVPSRWTCSKTPCGPRASRRSTSTTTSPPAYATTCRDLTAAARATEGRRALVVWKLDRLGRNLAHLVNTVQDLSTRGVAHRDTSVSELCRELGIRPVTLYRYVGPQEQLREQGEKVLTSPCARPRSPGLCPARSPPPPFPAAAAPTSPPVPRS